MLLTWEYEDYCILTKSWHMKNKQDLILSILFTALLGVAYELFKKLSAAHLAKLKPKSVTPLSTNASSTTFTRALKRYRLTSSALYGVQIFFSFLLMLIFMSFNYWIMISLSVGAAIGHFVFNNDATTTDESSLACH